MKAQQPAFRAEVRGVLGQVSVVLPGGETRPLQIGDTVEPGSTVKTGTGAALDLYLGNEANTVRLTQNTTLVLTSLQGTADRKDFDVHLTLNGGTLLGKTTPVPSTSKYRITVPHAILGILDGQFRVSAEGYHVLLAGTMVVVQMGGGAEPSSHTLKAPPEIYFSPSEGVRPAPPVLVREVSGQFKAQLPQR